jgi:hypothetical protein
MDPNPRAVIRWSQALVAASLLVTLVGACQRSNELRSQVETDQTGWKKSTASLRVREGNLDRRVRALPAEEAGAPIARSAQRRRVAALVIGMQESLVDLDRNIDDSVREVQLAIRRGDDEGERALTTAAQAIDGYVRQQEQSVAAAEAAVIKIEEVGDHGQERTAATVSQ